MTKPVHLCCIYTDTRNSINGLIALVQESFSLDPFADALFVFCNRDRNRIKILEWDGFELYFKRLARGRFCWPTKGDRTTMLLDVNELGCLIDSTRLEKKLSRKEVIKRQIS